jgi:hypothetical protein
MRSRHDKRRRSRISIIDRLFPSVKGIATLVAVRSTSATPVVHPPALKHSSDSVYGEVSIASPESTQVQPPSTSKRKNIAKSGIDRLQHPVGWWPLIVLAVLWIFMLGIIWVAFQEIMSLGVSPVKQTISQIERKSLIELFSALCLGGIGLSLALTPVLKRPRRDNPERLQSNIDRTTNK